MKNARAFTRIISCLMILPICFLTGCSFLPSAETIKEKVVKAAKDGYDDWCAESYEEWYKNESIKFLGSYTGRTQMSELTKLVVECFNRNDAERLKSLLCERTQGISGIDEQISEVLDFVGGGILSYNEPKHYPSAREGTQKRNAKETRTRLSWNIEDVITEKDEKFEISIHVNCLDIWDTSREGIMLMVIHRNDGERIRLGYYWKDYKDIAHDTARTLRNYIDARDTEGIRSMFCEQSQAHEELTSQVEALITFYEGASLRGKPAEPNKGNIKYDGRRDYCIYSVERETVFNNEPVRIFIDTLVDNMMTDADKTYTIRFSMYNRNDANPDAVGISQIILTRNDGKELIAGELIREDGDEIQIFIP